MSSARGTGTRRSNACWTCKLRRKKCDASKPSCAACSTRNISCHGYGDWPEWMDGGERERTELGRIQNAVKENKKRKRKEVVRDQTDSRRNSQQPSAAPNDVQMKTHGFAVASRYEEPASHSSVQDSPGPFTIEDPARNTFPLVPTTNSGSHFRFGHHREAELLMHYLDHVFALQFRFHSPSVASGGRGWLLWLLTETKPLYHAALSLGALHQHSLLARSVRGRRYHDTWDELNEHHNRALQELQVFLQSSYDVSHSADLGRKRRLQILACGTQLISFELFRGGTSQWQVHLDALAAVVSSVNETSFPGLQQDESTSDLRSSQGLSPDVDSGLQPHSLEDTAEQFLVGAALWFDVLSCVSTNTGPRLAAHHARLLQGGIDLANIAACQSWVAILIGEIATLNEWKAEASTTHNLSFWKLFERGDPVRRRLEEGIAGLRKEIDDSFAALGLAHLGNTAAYLMMTNPSLQTQAIKRAITLVFAYAAKVYLNTTISGADPSLDDVRDSVNDTMNALQELQFICDAQALRSLIWPICIAGCMAEDTSTQSFFRSLIQGLGDEAHNFGNSKTTLQVMEACWAAREDGTPGIDGKPWDWCTAMESLGQRVLLV